MPITIKYEKTLLTDGTKGVKIIEIEALSPKDVPRSYTSGFPNACLWALSTDPWLRIEDTPHSHIALVERETYAAQWFFEVTLPIIRRAGRRLRDINRRKRQQEWQGIKEIVI